MKILNLYAGIGGNAHNWSREEHDITHVEINEEIASCNQKLHPRDKVIVGDAYKHIEENHQDYDYIWASPPCPSHSSIRKAGAKNGQYQAKIPDMDLYGIIIFLDRIFEGEYCVENVNSYYKPLIKKNLYDKNNHYFWSSHSIPDVELDSQEHNHGNNTVWQEYYGIDLSNFSFDTVEKRQVLRNCVHPKLGKKILQA